MISKRLWLLVALFVCSVQVVLAQTSGTGSLTGTVTDESGASIPNATVTITSTQTAQSRSTMTGANGEYTFGLLPPGSYAVRFEAAGFQTTEVPIVTVIVTQASVLDRSLHVGAQTTSVTVESEVQAVQTESSVVGSFVNDKGITDLPLNSRNFTDLLAMGAGANAAVSNTTSLGSAGTTPSVNGASTTQNTYQMDGSAIDNFWGFNSVSGTGNLGGFTAGLVIPSPDAIQEFEIQTANYDAGYGRNVGANVNVVTKSGTNDFHGTAFEFFRNTVLNANDFFRNFTAGDRLPFNQNQFGGVLGGPIKKDKLFFFVSYQQTVQKNGITTYGFSSTTLPPLPAGNRGTCPVNYTSVSQCDAAGQAFIAQLGSNVCPTNPANASYLKFDKTTVGGLQVDCAGLNISPVAIKILQLELPSGNYYIPGSGSSSAYLAQTFSDPTLFYNYQGIGNLDYVINGKNTLSLRYLQAPDLQKGFITGSGGGTGIQLPGTPLTSVDNYNVANVKLTTLLSSNLVNEARISFVRYVKSTTEPFVFTDSQVGITPVSPQVNALTEISSVGGLFAVGETYFGDQSAPNNQFLWADQISWTHGRHTIRTGGEVGLTRFGISGPETQIGALTFSSFADFLIGRGACVSAVCSAASPGLDANGKPANGTQLSNVATLGGNDRADNGNAPQRYTTSQASMFIQDDFKLNSRLTLNMGLRWDYFGFVTEMRGRWSGFWPSIATTVPFPGSSPATGSLVGFVAPSNFEGALPAGVYRNTNSGIVNNPPLKNFGPRLGFAWQPLPTQKLVLRGGAGIFYDRLYGNVLALGGLGAEPYVVTGVVQPSSTLAAPFVLPPTIPGPPGTPGWTPRWVNYSNNSSSSIGSGSPSDQLAQHIDSPTNYEWNLNTQYEFLPSWILQVAYVGSQGIYEQGTGYSTGPAVNAARLASSSQPICTPGGCATNSSSATIPLRVPILGFSPLYSPMASTGDSKFNSLQVTVRKQLSHGLTLQAAYAWSRSFINVFPGVNGPVGSQPWATVYEPNPNYHPQRLVINYSWNIPGGHEKGILGAVTQGWTWSGVTTIQDGTPLTFVDTRSGTAYTSSAGGAGLVDTAQYCSGMSVANLPASGSLFQKVVNGLHAGTGYFNAGVFCAPPVIPASEGGNGVATGFGNVTIPTLPVLGPGQNNWDMALSKTTKVGGLKEDATLQFRAEFFNTWNHPQFSNPTATANSGSFGRITSESVGPRIVQFALKYAF